MEQCSEDIASTLNKQVVNEDDQRRTQARSKRRTPPRLDLSRLFTRRKSSQNSNPAPAPSSARTPRSVPLVEDSFNHPVIQSRSKDSSLSPRQVSLQSPRMVDDTPSPKVHVKRPLPGIQHWFDGMEATNDRHPDYFPENRQNETKKLNVDKPLPHCPRDTFLSMSTARTDSIGTENQNGNVKGAQRRNGDPKGVQQHAGDTKAAQSTRPPFVAVHPLSSHPVRERVRPVTSNSNAEVKSQSSSASTQRRKQSKRRKSPPKREHDANSNFEGHSVLVLSDHEDSDDLVDDESAVTTQVASIDGSIQEANVGTMMSVRSPKSIANPSAGLDRPLDPVEYHSSTSAASSSPDSDGGTFQDESEGSSPVSRCQGPWLSDSTSSLAPAAQEDDRKPSPTGPEWRDSVSLRQSEVSGRATPPIQRIANAFRNNPSRTHQLMAVTAEEAQLLATMRARRAAEQTRLYSPGESAQTGSLPRQRPGSSMPPGGLANRASKLHASTVFTDISESIPLAGNTAEEMASDAALLSPTRDIRESVAESATPRSSSGISDHGHGHAAKRPSTANVDGVWEDVQAWRKHTGAGLARSKSISRLQHSPRSRDSTGSGSARPVLPKGWNSDPAAHRTAWHGRGDSGGSDARSFSLGFVGDRGSTVAGSVKGELLAAWGDLGGLRGVRVDGAATAMI